MKKRKKKVKKIKVKKAIMLFSGGLDSMLAVKLLQEQRVEVIALHFISPFFSKSVENEAKQLHVKLIEIDLGSDKNIKEFINMVRKPRFGYGTAINPCIDCKILILKKAKQLMKKTKADFIATGEVLNERPMSQTREKLGIIELETGLQGRILRPLSARLLDETEIEKKKIIFQLISKK
jgi:tRNA U34 2-thiouridine synthase MnmA/TrmU